ncbi:hypothetical protein M2326_001756 [Flavobacterium sp. 7A]|nr:hypothetical protein [Flavobacterium sp. 7A]
MFRIAFTPALKRAEMWNTYVNVFPFPPLGLGQKRRNMVGLLVNVNLKRVAMRLSQP